MKKQFLINIFLLFFLNLLIKPLWVFVEISVQNKVGTECYGLYFALFNLSFIFYMILDAGIANYNSKEIAGSPQLAEKFMSRLIPLKLLLGLIYMIVIVIIGIILQYNPYAIFLLCFIGLNQFLIAFLAYSRSILQGLHFFKSDSIISITDRTIMVLLIAYVYYAGLKESFEIEWFIFIQTGGYLFAIFMCLTLIFYHSKIRPKFQFDRKFSLVFLKKSLPYTLIGMLMLLYGFTDSILLERLVSEKAAGIYAESSRILGAMSNIALLFSVLLLPLFSKMISKKENLSELIQLSSSLLILSAVFVACACAAFSGDIMAALYGKIEGYGMTDRIWLSFSGELPPIENAAEIALSAKVFTFVILNFIPISALYVYGTLLTAAGEMKWLNITAAIGVVISIAGNFILIPFYGPLGAAIISLLTQSSVCLLQVAFARKKFQLPFTTALFVKNAIALLAFGLSLLALKQSSLFWPLQIMGSVGFGLIIAVAIKAIPLPGISKLIKSRTS